MDKYSDVFSSNVKATLNFFDFILAMIPLECYTKRLNQTASFRPPLFVLLTSNDELDVSKSNFQILYHK